MTSREHSTLDGTAMPAAETASLRMQSPIGLLTLTANTAGEIVSVVIKPAGTLAGGAPPDDTFVDGASPESDMARRATAALRTAAHQLDEYFAGTRTAFTIKLATPAATDFRRRVWQRIARIPYGEGATYGQIALDIGKPGAGRAVGSAVAANTQPLFVGCHRVLGVAGHITGYSQGAGTPTKQWLLRHEGTPHRPATQRPDPPRLLATTSSTTSSSSPAAP